MDIDYWNKKIYKNEDGTFVDGGLNPKQFWEEFGIKSFPLFKDRCYYHIPQRWADDVKIFVKQVQDELGDRIEFTQIKEKWCELTVYYSSKDKEAGERLKELKKECVDRLIEKGVHPPRENI